MHQDIRSIEEVRIESSDKKPSSGNHIKSTDKIPSSDTDKRHTDILGVFLDGSSKIPSPIKYNQNIMAAPHNLHPTCIHYRHLF